MFFLLIVFGDVQPELRGPYQSDLERVAVARRHRERFGDRDGLFRINAHPLAGKPEERLRAFPFGGAELGPERVPELRFRRRAVAGRRIIPT